MTDRKLAADTTPAETPAPATGAGKPTAEAHRRNTAPATDRAVVVGKYPDGSGISDHAYGPYIKRRAQAVADRLTAGQWYGMQWSTLPIGALPGAGPSPDDQ